MVDLPQEILVEFFLRLDTFHQRRVASLVCKEWREAHGMMQQTYSRKARYGHFQFQMDVEARDSVTVSQGVHGPRGRSYVRTYDLLPAKTATVEKLSQYVCLSCMCGDGKLAHPWTWVSEELWSHSKLVGEDFIYIQLSEEFGFAVVLRVQRTEDEPCFHVFADGHWVAYPDLDLSLSISHIVVGVIQFALTWCTQDCTKLRELVKDYPYGMLERLHSHWQPWLQLRKGDAVTGKLSWRE